MNEITGYISGPEEISGSIMYTVLKGLSAYEIAVKNGYSGTEEEWLQSLIGESVVVKVIADEKSTYILSFTVGDKTIITPNLKPVLEKGVDYLTPEEVAELTSDILIELRSEVDDIYQRKGDYVIAETGKSLVLDSEIKRLSSVNNYDDSAIKEEIDEIKRNKVDKELGKSLISDSEIERLSLVTNYNDSEIKNDISRINTQIIQVNADLNDKVDKEPGMSLISEVEIIRLASVSNYNDTEVRDDIYDLQTNKAEKVHTHTKAEIGLGRVDNTSDMAKPVSTATQNAIDSSYTQATGYTDKKIADLINGAPETLDTLKEIADAMKESSEVIDALDRAIGTKANETDFAAHATNETIHITADERSKWDSYEDNKVNKVQGKDLSTNDFSNSYKNKLDLIAYGAEVNVQSDWNETRPTYDAYIKNKPTSLPASDVKPWAKADVKPTYTKEEIGLGNVDNTSDLDKPISTAVQAELNKKANTSSLGNKVDKEPGKSLIADTEIERLANVHNYNDSEIKADILNKVDIVPGKSLIADTEIDRLATVHNYDDSSVKAEIIQNGISAFTNNTTITDSADKCIKNLVIFGKCEQEANPTPTDPKDVLFWDGKITTRNSGSDKISSVDLGFDLYGIKVSNGGNYIDSNGQMWLCDKLNLETGVIERYLKSEQPVYRGITKSATYGDFAYCSSTSGLTNNAEKLIYHPKFTPVSNNDKTKAENTSKYRCYLEGGRFVFRYPVGINLTQDIFEMDIADTMCVYALATPVTEALTDVQFAALKKLKTYSDTTIIEYGNLVPFANVEYFKNTNNGISVADIDSKIPFRFGITEDGRYGYYKAGADSVTPFSSGGSSVLTYHIKAHDITGENASIASLNVGTMEVTVVGFMDMKDPSGYDFGDFKIDYGQTSSLAYTIHAIKPCTLYFKQYSTSDYTAIPMEAGDVHYLFNYNDGIAESFLKFE